VGEDKGFDYHRIMENETHDIITPALMRTILAQYPLPLNGVHGPAHWARVYENGLQLAAITGADPEVVQLFAVLHDSRRFDEGECLEHGSRAAHFAVTLRGTHIHLNDDRFRLLCEACERHTTGARKGDITLQTCWDADRLDLARVWITPDPERLCTEPAQDSQRIAWATKRAKGGFKPTILHTWLAE
jgi:uncharacterized protein